MVKGDPYRCEWCTFSWKTNSDVIPLKCPSCENSNILNEAECFKKILGEENILRFHKQIKKKSEVVEEVKKKESFFSRIFKNK